MPSVAAIHLLKGWKGLPNAIKLSASSALPIGTWFKANFPSEGSLV